MTICNKIQTLGETMETNLNARGVSCTFGTGTGESTVLDMVEMVNGTNFKGSSDVNLKIGANRPYLLENETTDVVVKLENGLCEPLKNKNVIVGQSVFRDGGVTGNKNTNYTTGSALTISTTTDGTSVSSTTSNSTTGRYKGNTAITGDFELIADVKLNQAYSSSVGLYFGVHSNDYTIFRIKTQEYVKVKIKRENGVYTVQTSTDGTTWTDGTFQQDKSTSSSVYPVLYVYNNTGSNNGLSYKNLVLNNTLTGVTDEKGEFALYNVSVTDNTIFNATYGTETATTNVYLCQFVDYAVTGNSNLIQWFYAPSYSSANVDASGTTFTSVRDGSFATVSATLTQNPTSTDIYPYSFPLTVEFDLIGWEDNQGATSDYARIRIYNQANNKIAFWSVKDYGVGHYKIVCSNGSQKLYFNGVEQSRSFTHTPTTQWNVAFQTKGHIKFHNLAIY